MLEAWAERQTYLVPLLPEPDKQDRTPLSLIFSLIPISFIKLIREKKH
jgi:hypothetical protein